MTKDNKQTCFTFTLNCTQAEQLRDICERCREKTLLYKALRPEALVALLWLPNSAINSQDITDNSVLHENTQIFVECPFDTLRSGKEEILIWKIQKERQHVKLWKKWIEEEKTLSLEERSSNFEDAIRLWRANHKSQINILQKMIQKTFQRKIKISIGSAI